MSGYIGTTPVPQATQHRETFTANADQTTFATAGYTVGYIDVWVNGVKLAAADMTVTNGSDIVLASAAAANDIVEYVAFVPFEATNQTFTGATVINSLNINSDGATVTGIKDEDNMASNDANKLATQQSIKAYVDATVAATNEVVEDTTPQLGGDLASNGNDILMADNDKAIFGAGSDLQIYHDGNDSIIRDVGTGDLRLRGTSLAIEDSSGNEFIKCSDGGTGGTVFLKHLGAIKLTTTTTGIDVTGVITTDGLTTSANINFGDSDKAIFGGGSDLQIYHNGSNSYIDDAGTGNLFVRANNLRLSNADNSQYYLIADNSGFVKLNYSGSEKLATTATGINVTGNATFGDNEKAIFGAGSDLEIYHDGSNSYIEDTGTGSLIIEGTNLVLRADDGSRYLQGVDGASGVTRLYHPVDDAIKLSTTATGISVTGSVTADGLTVDGASAGRATLGQFTNTTNAGGTEAAIDLRNQAGGNADVSLVASRTGANFGSDFYIETSDGVDGTNRKRLNVGENGDISFYEDTGTTAKLVWDAAAESLTVNGDVNIDDAIPILRLDSPATTWSGGEDLGGLDWYTKDTSSSGPGVMARIYSESSGTNTLPVPNMIFQTSQSALSLKDRMKISGTGDISFYEDTGTTAKFFWDASAESLGIGTILPSASYSIDTAKGIRSSGAAPNFTLQETDASNQTWLMGSYGGSFAIRDTTVAGTSYPFKIEAAAPSDTLYLDTSGSVGIGISIPEGITSGITTLSISDLGSKTTGDKNGVLAFKTNDASYTGTYSDGVTGEIYSISESATGAAYGLGFLTGTIAGTDRAERMRIDSSGNVGIGVTPSGHRLQVSGGTSYFLDTVYIAGGTGKMISSDSVGNPLIFGRNNSEDMRLDDSGHAIIPAGVTLGTSVGVYNAANTLDDYEEGTFTPTFVGSTGGSVTLSTSSDTYAYTKVGRVVTITGRVDVSGTPSLSGNLLLQGLPFSSGDLSDSAGYTVQYGFITIGSSNTGNPIVVELQENVTEATLRLEDWSSASGVLTNNSRIQMSITYFTS